MPDAPPSLDEMIAALRAVIHRQKWAVYHRSVGMGREEAAEHAALEAALAQLEASRWRPIAEAPKDGTDILVNDGDITAIASWNGRWSESWTGEDFNVGGDRPAIRWCPLPAPPAAASEGETG